MLDARHYCKKAGKSLEKVTAQASGSRSPGFKQEPYENGNLLVF